MQGLSNSWGGEIKESAPKSDLTSISESGTTARQAISAGTIFYLNGVLVRAIATIASGATFTLGTNIETTDVNNELKGIAQCSQVGETKTIATSYIYFTNSELVGQPYVWVKIGSNVQKVYRDTSVYFHNAASGLTSSNYFNYTVDAMVSFDGNTIAVLGCYIGGSVSSGGKEVKVFV